jgi:ribosomal protein S18 acetylase RimI-like enzyme
VGPLVFRIWTPEDVPFLWEMLYQSLHVRDGHTPFPRSVLREPGIAHYLTEFGSRDGDDAQVCVDGRGERVGAAWVRRMTADDPGYGYVSDEIPEVGMAVEERSRGQGIGRRLLEILLGRHPCMSLSVDDDNVVAVGLYRSIGFVPVESVGGSTTMIVGSPPALADQRALR